MTKSIQYYKTCPHCGATVSLMTAFSEWLRALPAPYDSRTIDNEDLDFIWFNYHEGWFVTLEEKCNGARSSPAQQDTHGIIEQLLRLSSGARVYTLRGTRPIDYRGHYVLVFEHSTPDDSQWIKINGALATKRDLMDLLRTGSLPLPVACKVIPKPEIAKRESIIEYLRVGYQISRLIKQLEGSHAMDVPAIVEYSDN